MISIRPLLAQVAAFFRKRELDQDLDDELSAHLAMSFEDNLKAGMAPEEARRRALVSLGGIDSARELHRASRGLPTLETILQDIRYGYRTLRRDAGLATFAVLIVGLGVGATSSVFSVVNALMLRPLPFEEPQRILWIANKGVGLSGQTVQVGHLQDLQTQSQAFSDISGYFAFYGVGDNKLTGDGESERLTGVPVTENFFQLLGVRPLMGRLFSPEECKWNGPRAVLLSYRVWERRFASDPEIVGRSLTINDQPVTVVGVLPASFDFGPIFAPGSRIDVYRPFPLSEETNRQGNTLALIGRLRPGATIQSARAEVSAIAERGGREHPERNTFRPDLSTLREHVSGQFRPALLVLSCAVGLVMLIVCANLSNLLLARAATREKEIAIRAALGADRWRLIRQMLTESLMLSCIGAALGLLLAVLGTRLLSQLDASIPLLGEVRVDSVALTFTILTALITGIFFGLTPALRMSSLQLHDALKESSRGSSESKGQGRLRGVLVVCEIAFACVLLVGAGLLIRSFLLVLDVDLGFQPQNAITLRIDPGRQYSTQALRNAYFDDMFRRVSAVPGFEASGVTDALPLGSNRSWGVSAKGQTYERGKYPEAFVRVVSEGYLPAMKIPVRRGRDFTARDNPGSPHVIIINETLARTLWPGEDPIGKMMKADVERQVVGVVGDVRHLSLEQKSGSEMYLPIRQSNDYASVALVVRGTQSSAGLVSGVRAALKTLDPQMPTKEIREIQELVDRSVSPRRLIVLLLAGFAGMALILASLGIYGVMSYSVTQRRHEIGIRMALGARPGDVLRLVLRQGLTLALIGVTVGLVAAFALTRVLQGLLFGVSATDPLIYTAGVTLLTAVAMLACLIPARRAMLVDPLIALRNE